MAGSDKEAYKKTGDEGFTDHPKMVGYLTTVARSVYGREVRIEGCTGETGLAIWTSDLRNRQLIGVVWHPDHTGGDPTVNHMESFIGRKVGWGRAQKISCQVLEVVKRGGFSAAASQVMAFCQGFEIERHLHDRKSGSPFRLPYEAQEEFQFSMLETTVGPAVGLGAQSVLLAQDVVQVSKEYPGAYVNMTGMMVGARPQDVGLNEGAHSVYVRAMSDKLMRACSLRDELSAQAWADFASHHGYESFGKMLLQKGDVSLITFAASHINCSVAQIKEGDRWVVPLELLTAVGWMMNSRMSLVAKWMMYSGGIAQGVRVTRIDKNGGVVEAKSARDVMRRVLLTTDPARSPETADEFFEVAVPAIINGVADRVARAGMIARGSVENRGKDYAVPHGHQRFRNEGGYFYGPNKKPSGRMEFVSGDSVDIVARLHAAAFLQLLQLGAYEAVSKGVLPREYWGCFKSLEADGGQVELSDSFNFFGVHHDCVRRVVEEALEYVKYIERKYVAPDVQEACKMARRGLRGLLSGEGTLTERVVRLAYGQGNIVEAVHEAQLNQARLILEYGGDVLALRCD